MMFAKPPDIGLQPFEDACRRHRDTPKLELLKERFLTGAFSVVSIFNAVDGDTTAVLGGGKGKGYARVSVEGVGETLTHKRGPVR